MQRIGFLIYPGFQIMSLAPASVFEFANVTLKRANYEISIVSESGGLVASSLGAPIQTEAIGTQSFDTLLIAGAIGVPTATSSFLDIVRNAPRISRRVASICTGTFLLAEAGLLEGRHATTHWVAAHQLKQAHAEVIVDEDRIFIVDGNIWTSAGMSAGIDLALSMVEKDLGAELARKVAQKLVIYHRRTGGQSQFSTLLELEPKSDRIQNALTYAKSHLRSPLSVEELAAAAHLSPRQFSRSFTAETGQSPAKAVEHLRVEAARLMMEQTRHSIEIIAREVGFADRERMRRAFLRMFGQSPQAMRRHGLDTDTDEILHGASRAA